MRLDDALLLAAEIDKQPGIHLLTVSQFIAPESVTPHFPWQISISVGRAKPIKLKSRDEWRQTVAMMHRRAQRDKPADTLF